MKKKIRKGRSGKSDKCYVFKVALAGRQRVWRAIAVRGDQTLDDLHEAIFTAFDRDEEHLYSFYRGKSRRKYDVEYVHHYALEDISPIYKDIRDSLPPRPSVYDAAKTRVDSVGFSEREKFWYLFDCGDCWEHIITVKKIIPVDKKTRYPRIIDQKGESPEQYPDIEDE
ncbi:MAG: plasmid pRiA4b ORF-3 family protein [Candidatus Altiarchaeota archaeon]